MVFARCLSNLLVLTALLFPVRPAEIVAGNGNHGELAADPARPGPVQSPG